MAPRAAVVEVERARAGSAAVAERLASTPMGKETAATDARIREAELGASEAIGTLIEFWGFKRPMGRIWTLLYLSPEPLPATVLCERLQMSAGAASMTLSELEQWGVVHRSRKVGDRKEYFAAETDLWKMISRVWREREMRQIERALEAFDRARRAVEAISARPEAGSPLAFKLERLRLLTSLAKLGDTITRMVVEQGRIDLSPLKAWRGDGR